MIGPKNFCVSMECPLKRKPLFFRGVKCSARHWFVILADEPTASLDYSNAFRVMEALINAAFDLKATLLVVTHDSQMLKRFNRVLTIENGTIRGPGL